MYSKQATDPNMPADIRVFAQAGLIRALDRENLAKKAIKWEKDHGQMSNQKKAGESTTSPPYMAGKLLSLYLFLYLCLCLCLCLFFHAPRFSLLHFILS